MIETATPYPHASASEHATTERAIERWQRVTVRGNRAHTRGDRHGALSHYRAALSLADGLYGLDSVDPDPALAALVISHHNLADMFEAQGAPDTAAAHLCLAYEALIHAIEDEGLAHPWRDAAWRHARIALEQLQRFLQRHPGHPRATRSAAWSPLPIPAQPH
ncbi:DUF2753 family protein [Bordetella genomosp. 1]|uniref:Tetratricopeptide repeat protein n=1 Tax=Bordetella genomosp. 1 TaxID=1395607 RepID=A0ABX4F2K6_9BORD|nr:DUF2753 family protein [Bordetella genomosp. 1]OZI67917.1 hypothetical protein CAL27_00115 [Bordetella genomosp. 1]